MRRGYLGSEQGIDWTGGLGLEGNYGRLKLLAGEDSVNIFNLEFKLKKKIV